MLKALVIRAPENKPNFDLGDVLQIARAEAKKAFGIRENVQVKDIIQRDYGYVVVVLLPSSCSKPQDCKRGAKVKF